MPALRLLIADDRAVLRAGLRAAIAGQGDVVVVGEAMDLATAEQASGQASPDVVLVQATLPPEDGLALCERLKSNGALPRVLVLGDLPDQELLLGTMEVGADGYTTSDQSLQAILGAIRAVHRGEACVPRHMVGGLLSALITRRRQDEHILARYMELTRREKEVLELLAEGCDHQEVASILVISPQTARTHIQNVMQKLGVHSRLEAVALAVEHGLTEARRGLGRAS